MALISRGNEVHTEVVGRLAVGDAALMRRDTIFRIVDFWRSAHEAIQA